MVIPEWKIHWPKKSLFSFQSKPLARYIHLQYMPGMTLKKKLVCTDNIYTQSYYIEKFEELHKDSKVQNTIGLGVV